VPQGRDGRPAFFIPGHRVREGTADGCHASSAPQGGSGDSGQVGLKRRDALHQRRGIVEKPLTAPDIVCVCALIADPLLSRCPLVSESLVSRCPVRYCLLSFLLSLVDRESSVTNVTPARETVPIAVQFQESPLAATDTKADDGSGTRTACTDRA
jgi:hypothetical protein